MELALWCLVAAVIWVGIETHFNRKVVQRLGELVAEVARALEQED